MLLQGRDKVFSCSAVAARAFFRGKKRSAKKAFAFFGSADPFQHGASPKNRIELSRSKGMLQTIGVCFFS